MIEIFEYDTITFRVVWKEPSGMCHYSKHFSTEGEARVHATTHHRDWPWAITQESCNKTVVHQSHDKRDKAR